MMHVHDTPVYRKSSGCGENGSCVEVAICGCGETKMRDSKDPTGPMLQFTEQAAQEFLAGVKAGEFDR